MKSPDALFSVQGKVALVTGAAGQLGSSFCDALEAAGAIVARTDVEASQGIIAMDVTDESSVRAALTDIAAQQDRIDVLVNNAGIGVYTPLDERVPEELARVLAVNVTGTILCTRAVIPLMTAGASIINIASLYGVVSPDPRIYGDSGRNSAEVYGASKAGVIQLTKWFAVHLAARGVRVNCLSPGGVFAEQGGDFVSAYESRTPLARMATPEDLHGGLLYLASDASTYVTGHNLVIDGGWSAW